MRTRRGSVRRVMSGAIVAPMLAITVAWPVAAQDEAPGMCTMFDIAALSAATAQEYTAEPRRDSPEVCEWATTSDQNLGLRVSFEHQPYDRLREQVAEFEELEVGGMPSFVTSDTIPSFDRNDEIVVVDNDGTTPLRVVLKTGIDEIPDQREQAVALAETVVATHPGPTFSIPELAPPPVEDVVWSDYASRSGQGDEVAEFMGDALDPLLEALERDYSGVSLLTTQSDLDVGSDYDFVGFLRSIRIEGADQAAIVAALEGFLDSVAGGEELESVTLGGKDVVRAQTGSTPEGLHAYVADDTLYVIEISDPQVVEALLQALR